MTRQICALLLFVASICPFSLAQQNDGFLSKWFNMVTATQDEQPRWVTPVATVTPRLEQEFRFDMFRQLPSTGDPLWNVDGGKGLEVIPEKHIELLFNLPPYLIHDNPKIKDGWGDVSFLMKFRILSGNAEHGNYILTAFLGAWVPSGQYKNGAAGAVVTPSIAGGKGWGKFDFQSTFGGGLPVTNENTIGHALAWNTAFQYHVSRYLWPEAEVNSTFWINGTNDGRKQVFLTPGFVLGRFPIHNRIGFTMGAGMQIAVSQYYSYNHGVIVTARMPF